MGDKETRMENGQEPHGEPRHGMQGMAITLLRERIVFGAASRFDKQNTPGVCTARPNQMKSPNTEMPKMSLSLQRLNRIKYCRYSISL